MTGVAVLCGTPAALAAEAPVGSAARLNWLAGCWRMEGARGRVVEEQWMAPAGGILLGHGRTTRGDTLMDFEQTLIHTVNGRLTFTAHPHQQEKADFALKEQTDSLVVFEDLTHDFPQRVQYRLMPDGACHARVEGMMKGALRGIDFQYKPVDCRRGR